jgi:hypothetical protein
MVRPQAHQQSTPQLTVSMQEQQASWGLLHPQQLPLRTLQLACLLTPPPAFPLKLLQQQQDSCLQVPVEW